MLSRKTDRGNGGHDLPVSTLAHWQPALPFPIACRALDRRSVSLEVSAPKRMTHGASAVRREAIDVPDQFFSVKGRHSQDHVGGQLCTRCGDRQQEA